MNSVSVNRYLMAPAIGAFAVAAWMALHQLTPMGEHTTLLQLAIVASALGWGWQAGLATMLTAGLGLVLFILPPEGSFSIADRGDMVAVPVYFAVGSVLVALAATSRSLRERARLHQAAAEEREHAISTECAARALAEEHLRHSEERYRTLLELCPDAVSPV